MRYLIPLALLAMLAAYWSCAAAPPAAAAERDPLAGTPVPASVAFDDPVARGSTAFASLLGAAAPQVVGRARVIYPRTACWTRRGNPLVAVRTLQPKAGAVVAVDWSTVPTTPPAAPGYVCALFVSLTPSEPLALGQWGAPGCWLLVPPQFVVLPQPGSWFFQDGGELRLRWTPEPWTVGRLWRLQLLVDSPGAPSGRLLSPAVELVIGNV